MTVQPEVVAVHLNSTLDPTATLGELVHVLISISSSSTSVTDQHTSIVNTMTGRQNSRSGAIWRMPMKQRNVGVQKNS